MASPFDTDPRTRLRNPRDRYLDPYFLLRVALLIIPQLNLRPMHILFYLGEQLNRGYPRRQITKQHQEDEADHNPLREPKPGSDSPHQGSHKYLFLGFIKESNFRRGNRSKYFSHSLWKTDGNFRWGVCGSNICWILVEDNYLCRCFHVWGWESRLRLALQD